jgi:O-antigen ligase
MTKFLLYLNIFFLQSYLLRFSLGIYPTNLQEILIGVLAVHFLIHIIQEKKLWQTIKNILKHKAILGFLVLTILTISIIEPGSQIDFFRHLKFLFFGSILAFIFLELLEKPSEREKGIRIMGIGAILFGVFSLILNLSGINIAHDLRLLGPLDAAVYLAFYLAPFFLFFAIQFFEKRKSEDLFWAVLAGLLLLATRSMGAIGASAIIMLLYFIRYKKINKTILALIIIAILATIFYTKILPTLQTNYSSLDERGEIWKTAIQLLKEPKNLLLGVGFGQFEHYYIQNVEQVLGRLPLDFHVIQPHNIFFLFIFHYGILGLAFLSYLIWRIIAVITHSSKTFHFKKLAAIIALYFIIHGLIDTPFFKNDLLFLLLLFMELPYCKPSTKSIKTA